MAMPSADRFDTSRRSSGAPADLILLLFSAGGRPGDRPKKMPTSSKICPRPLGGSDATAERTCRSTPQMGDELRCDLWKAATLAAVLGLALVPYPAHTAPALRQLRTSPSRSGLSACSRAGSGRGQRGDPGGGQTHRPAPLIVLAATDHGVTPRPKRFGKTSKRKRLRSRRRAGWRSCKAVATLLRMIAARGDRGRARGDVRGESGQ